MTVGMWTLLVGALGLFPQPLHAADLQVQIMRPNGREAVFGVIEVEVDVQAHEPVTVELFLDGTRVGADAEAPYLFTVDVGDRNVEHRFEALALGNSGMVQSATLETPSIRIDESVEIALQQLYVTVSDDRGRVLDLDQEDFVVYDGGGAQHLVTFMRGEVPITATLLLDASQSMDGPRFEAALRGAEVFVRGMRDLDEAKLVLFSDQMLRTTSFTNGHGPLLAALDGAEAGGNTSINDHLYYALRMLDARQGRRVVVLFTDGADLHSVLDMEDVLWAARRSQALIYWIRLEDGGSHAFSTAWRDADHNQEELELLERAVEQSGGRIAVLRSDGEIETAFRDILLELREQYVLGYYPQVDRDDGSWRKVDVKVKRGSVRVRTRGGYVDF